MIKAYPVKWEIIDEESGLDVGIIKAFDEYSLTLSLDSRIVNSDEMFTISQIFKQIEEIYKKGLSHSTTEDALQEIADFGQLQDKCDHEYDHNGECLKCDEPMSEWVGLTDEEIYKRRISGLYLRSLGYSWNCQEEEQSKLKEKNT